MHHKKIYSAKAYPEIFHLIFMDYFHKNIDSILYALKGGCNIRFFFQSIRYSEDIDIDVQKIAVETLKNKVDKIFSNVFFKQALKAYGIDIVYCEQSKQTQVTQRWKIQLKVPVQVIPISTKIEFSRRVEIQNANLGILSHNFVNEYMIKPIFLSHYDKKSAILQKFNDLINRTEAQARDIFDLGLLLKDYPSNVTDELNVADKEKALLNMSCVGFKEFESQVVSYLEFNAQQYYNSPESYKIICEDVARYLKH